MDATPATAMELAALDACVTPPTRAAPMPDAVTFIDGAMPFPERTWSGGSSARKDSDSATWTAHRAPLDPKTADARCVPTGKEHTGQPAREPYWFPFDTHRRSVVYYFNGAIVRGIEWPSGCVG